MSKNQYQSFPEWKPTVLPYELIMKAADMKQQRWDAANAAGQKTVDDLFSNVKTIQNSVDDRVHMQEAREDWSKRLEKIYNDPNISPALIQQTVGSFSQKWKPRFDRYSNYYDLYKAGQVAMIGERTKDDTIMYPTELQYDISKWDSNDPNADIMNTQPVSLNPTRKITDSYFDNHPEGFIAYSGYDAEGKPTGLDKGTTLDNIMDIAQTNTNTYLNTDNYKGWNTLTEKRQPDYVPDRDLANLGRTFFNNKSWAELTPQEKAQAIILKDGQERINVSEQYIKQARGRTGMSSTQAAKIVRPPWETDLLSNVKITPDQFERLGVERDKETGLFKIDPVNNASGPLTIVPSTISNLDPKTETELVIYNEFHKLKDKHVSLGLMKDYNTAKDNFDKIKSLPGVGPGSRGYETAKTAYDDLKKQYDASTKNWVNDPQRDQIVQKALANGIDLNSPEFNQNMAKLSEDDRYKKTQQLGQIFALSGQVLFDLDGTRDNFVNIGNQKYAKGKFNLTKDEIETKLHQAHDAGLLSGIEDFGGQLFRWGDDFNKAFGDVMNVHKNAKGEDIYEFPVMVPVDINNQGTYNLYNRTAPGVPQGIVEANMQQWDMTRDARIQAHTAGVVGKQVFENDNAKKVIATNIDKSLRAIKDPAMQAIAIEIVNELNNNVKGATTPEGTYEQYYRLLSLSQGLNLTGDKLSEYIRMAKAGLDESKKAQPQGQNSNPLGQ